MDEQKILEAQERFAAKKESFWAWFHTFFTWENLFKLIGMVFVIFIIWVVYKLVSRAVKKINPERMTKQRSELMKKFIKYAFNIIVIMYIMSCCGIKLNALLGAAGVFGLAIGFAAQTTASNLISGLFVITEGSIHIGDFIIVDGVMGVVDSLDLLSTRIHTLDNQMVRIPNASIIDTNLQNNSFFPHRRVTFAVCCKYGTDIKYALDVFLKAPSLCSTVLKDPAPVVWVDGFGDNNINMTIAVWCKGADLIATKNAMYIALQKVMEENGLSMAYNVMEITSHENEPLLFSKTSV